MRRLLLLLVLLTVCWLPMRVYAQGAGARTTVVFLPRSQDPAAGPTCTAAAGCTSNNWFFSQSDPATATVFYSITNGLCEAATTQGGTAPTAFDIFIQACPNGNCTMTTGDWDDFARFTMGATSSKHVIGWTTAAQLHGHTLCSASTAAAAGTCNAQTTNCLPPDCTRGYYWGDRLRVATVLTGGDGTTTETFTLKCFLTATQ
jgi:hypothetical protein